MSDVATNAQLSPAVTQLPVSGYFDEKVFELEMKLLFDAGPGYVGHELMVPGIHDYRTQEWRDHARMLLRQPDGIYEMSNICRHRQAIMLQGSGQARHIVCPIHRWTYDGEGKLIGAPHFPANPCLNLGKRRLEPVSSISRATSSTASNCTRAITTGRPSSRSISRITTSCPTIRGSATSSPATT